MRNRPALSSSSYIREARIRRFTFANDFSKRPLIHSPE